VNTGTPPKSGGALRPAAWHEVAQALAITDRERDRRRSPDLLVGERFLSPSSLIPFVIAGGNTMARECALRLRWMLVGAEREAG